MPNFVSADWCWLLPDGRAYLSGPGAVVSADDKAVAQWSAASGMPPTPCPPDESGAPTLAALQSELARWGLNLPGADPLVPVSVSSAQAKIQCLRTPGATSGKTLLDDITAKAQAAAGETQIWFTEARTWERANPYVASLSSALKLTKAQVDALFVSAAKISA